jgi:hypothetical protein
MKTELLSKTWLMLITAAILTFALPAHGEDKEKDKVKALKARIEELEKINRALQAKLSELSNPLSIAAVEDWKLVQALQGALLFAQNEESTFLGILDFTGKHVDSIFNEIGTHGSSIGLESIWNKVGYYGSVAGPYSARSRVCMKPPVIIKDKSIIGHLTVSTLAVSPARVDPDLLRYFAKQIQGKR